MLRSTKREQAKQKGFRSWFEYETSQILEANKISFQFEHQRIKYFDPARYSNYLPDFKIADNVFIECKGRFTTADRHKHLCIKEQFPNIIIIMVFEKPKNVIYKGSNTTYAKWCDKHGIPWITLKDLNIEWLEKFLKGRNLVSSSKK